MGRLSISKSINSTTTPTCKVHGDILSCELDYDTQMLGTSSENREMQIDGMSFPNETFFKFNMATISSLPTMRSLSFDSAIEGCQDCLLANKSLIQGLITSD
jgi:hypothetical protein